MVAFVTMRRCVAQSNTGNAIKAAQQPREDQKRVERLEALLTANAEQVQRVYNLPSCVLILVVTHCAGDMEAALLAGRLGAMKL